MIQINEARVSADNKCLIIDTQIQDIQYFIDSTIESIYIDTEDTFVSENNPSVNAVCLYKQGIQEQLDLIQDPTKRHVRIEATSPLIDTKKTHLYFIYINANPGPDASNAPCYCNKEKVLKVVANMADIYKVLMGNIKELNNECSVPANFINNFLRLNAVEAAVNVGNYKLAIEYFTKFFKKNEFKVTNKTCGCYAKL